MSPETPPPLSLRDYQDAAALRSSLRAFMRQSERRASGHGLTPQRQQLLLFIKGAPDGSERATVSDLADRLQLARNTVTELVTRAEQAGLLTRRRAPHDGRVVWVSLTPEGERRLSGTVAALRRDRDALIAAIASLDGLDGR